MVIEFEYSFACFGGDGDVLSDGADVYDGSAGALPVLLRGGGQQGLQLSVCDDRAVPYAGAGRFVAHRILRVVPCGLHLYHHRDACNGGAAFAALSLLTKTDGQRTDGQRTDGQKIVLPPRSPCRFAGVRIEYAAYAGHRPARAAVRGGLYAQL